MLSKREAPTTTRWCMITPNPRTDEWWWRCRSSDGEVRLGGFNREWFRHLPDALRPDAMGRLACRLGVPPQVIAACYESPPDGDIAFGIATVSLGEMEAQEREESRLVRAYNARCEKELEQMVRAELVSTRTVAGTGADADPLERRFRERCHRAIDDVLNSELVSNGEPRRRDSLREGELRNQLAAVLAELHGARESSDRLLSERGAMQAQIDAMQVTIDELHRTVDVLGEEKEQLKFALTEQHRVMTDRIEERDKFIGSMERDFMDGLQGIKKCACGLPVQLYPVSAVALAPDVTPRGPVVRVQSQVDPDE